MNNATKKVRILISESQFKTLITRIKADSKND